MKPILTKGILSLCSLLLVACGGDADYTRSADRNDIITVGDSIFDLSDELQGNLENYAGQTFRKYTLSGAELEGGLFATPVVDQYQEARADDSNITTVVMDGGGNDILIPVITLADPHDCKTQWYEFGRLSRECRNFIDDLYVEAVDLLNEMAADGVDDVIYLGYYYTKDALLWLDSLEEAVDYGDGVLAAACENSAVNCTFVDPRSSINDNDIIYDGIHPASSGSRKLADLIWPELEPLL